MADDAGTRTITGVSASARLHLRGGHQTIERQRASTVVQHLTRQRQSVRQVRHRAADEEGRRGVERHDVAVGSRFTGQHLAGVHGVRRGITADQLVGPSARQAERRRVEGGGPNLATNELEHSRRTGGGQLIEPVFAVNDHDVLGPVGLQHRQHAFGHRDVGHPDHHAADPGRVGQRAEDVERGGDAQLAAGWAGVAQRGVEARRQAEADAGLDHAAGDAGGRQLDGHAERLEQIGSPATGRRRPVAVLADRDARARDDECRESRHVDAAAAVTTGTDDVDCSRAKSSGSRIKLATASMASSRPLSSSIDSPFMRRATANAPSWADVASPARISSMAARAVAASRSLPDTSRLRTAGQPPRSTSRLIGGRSGRAPALADDPASLPLGRATPHALFLPTGQGVLQAGCSYATRSANRFCAVCLLIGVWVEDRRVEPPASSELPPVDFLYRHVSPPKKAIKRGTGSPHAFP